MFTCPVIRVAGLLALIHVTAARADTIVVDGKPIPNAEMQSLSETGVQFKTPDGLVTIPWADLNPFQKAAVHTQFLEQLENLRIRAMWLEGTVFEVTRDGVVVQVGIDLKGAGGETSPEGEGEKKEKPVEWKNGAEVIKGMVMVKDMKDSRAKNPGDAVAGLYFKTGKTFTYEISGFNLIKELPVLTERRPDWASERVWTNHGGQKLKARLVAVKDDKCLLQSSGKNFPYEITQLSEEDQALIAEYRERIRQIPVP